MPRPERAHEHRNRHHLQGARAWPRKDPACGKYWIRGGGRTLGVLSPRSRRDNRIGPKRAWPARCRRLRACGRRGSIAPIIAANLRFSAADGAQTQKKTTQHHTQTTKKQTPKQTAQQQKQPDATK